MKRLISILLTAVVLVLSLSTGAFAAEPTGVFDEIDTNNGISFNFRTNSLFNETELSDYFAAFKDDKFAFEFQVEFLKLKIILNKNSLYVYSPDFPLLHAKIEGENMLPEFDYEPEKLELVKTEEKNVDGKTLTTETYIISDESQVIITYIDGSIKSTQITSLDDESYYCYIDNFNFEVDDSVFELPRFSLDITPVINFFLGFFSGILYY